MNKTKHMKNLILILSLLMLAACGPSRVKYDFDKQVDFSKYRTYHIYPEIKSGLSELDEKRVVEQLERVLSLKGIRKSDTPDVYVNFYSNQYETPSNKSIGVGLGTFGRRVGGTVSGGIPIGGNVLNESLTVDLIDIATGSMVWQGSISSSVSRRQTPDERELFIGDLLSRIFQKYPPSVKK